MYSIDINHLDTQTLIFISTASPLASSPWQTMDNHEVMQTMVTDLDSNSSIEKDNLILFPSNISLNQKHNTFLSFICLINEIHMFQTQNLQWKHL